MKPKVKFYASQKYEHVLFSLSTSNIVTMSGSVSTFSMSTARPC